MDIFSNLLGAVNFIPAYIIPFLFVLTIVVFFHELGHFLVARWCGVSVEVFAVGFGREIFGFNDRYNTRWKFCWIPLGGYVKFLGDENAASAPDTDKLKDLSPEDSAGSFHHKSLSARSAVVAAGPIANFILSIVIFTGIFMFVGRQMTAPVVDVIQPGGAAAAAGFQVGDVVTEIDGKKIQSFSALQRIVSTGADVEMVFTVKRGNKNISLKATPKRREIKDRFGNVHKVGLLGVSRNTSAGNVVTQRYGPVDSVLLASQETWFVATRTLGYLYDVVVGKEDANQLGGPLRIAQISGQVATISYIALLNLAAVLSVSIGLLNLFPIPMLDGGHLVFYAIEGIRGKPLSDRAQDFGFRIGLALVISLMIFATWNDLVHFDVF